MEIIFQDDDLIVVDKAAGEVVHPSPGHEAGAMTDELRRRFPEIAAVGSRERPGVVHRLDIDTSGVMVFARNQRAYLKLREQFESHVSVEKTYLAVCHGSPMVERNGRRVPCASGTLEGPVGRDRRHAITHWQVLARKGGVALVEFRIETGRMHQIRIHAAELGCPIVCDATYGDKVKDVHLRARPRRTLLHAVALAFLHPSTGKRVEFSAPPPSDIVYAV